MTQKKDAEPLKLMPLDEFKKFVQAIAHVPKDALEKSGTEKPKNSTKKR